MDMLFKNKVSPEFASKVRVISSRLGIDPSWLMFVMESESGLNPYIQNSIGATGLIQFLPSTTIGIGTTTDDLKNMDGVSQLDYVYEYLKNYKGEMTDVYDLYLTIFYPSAIGKDDSYVFPANVVSSNPIFFKTGNMLKDFKNGINSIIYSKVPSEYYDMLIKKKEIFCRSIKRKLLLAA